MCEKDRWLIYRVEYEVSIRPAGFKIGTLQQINATLGALIIS